MLRNIVEYISRGKELKRRLPEDMGGFAIVVSPDAGGLRYWRKNLAKADPELIGLARELVRPGFVVWDVGANQGIFSLSAAWLAGPKGVVIAIEPDIWLANLLSNSCVMSARMARAPIIVVPLAAGDSVGERLFHIANRARASNHLDGFGNSQSGGMRWSLTVLAVTLDWLAQHLPPPQLLKVDVEGAELSVLRGATVVLREHRPVLLCEVNDQHSAECTEILRSLDYALYDGSVSPSNRRRLDRCRWSTIAIPEEAETSKSMDAPRQTAQCRGGAAQGR